GGYYGWPDHASGVPVTDPRFRLPGHPTPRRLLNNAPNVSGVPVATFPARSGVGRFNFSTSEQFGFVGQALVALSGPWSAAAYPGEGAPSPTGHRVVRVDPRTGEAVDFLVNRNAAPSSSGNTGGLERPFDVRFDPTGEVLYVVDLGEIQLNREYGLEPFGGTGVVWRITKIRPILLTPSAAEPAAQSEPAGEAEEPEVEAADEGGTEGGEAEASLLDVPPFEIPEPAELLSEERAPEAGADLESGAGFANVTTELESAPVEPEEEPEALPAEAAEAGVPHGSEAAAEEPAAPGEAEE
ncbi:MAG TPA: hypothetical protein VFU47_02980, partial [Armatimonadota bacterium]|nr:hypothetical protein [Armatimonadota bacterium]